MHRLAFCLESTELSAGKQTLHQVTKEETAARQCAMIQAILAVDRAEDLEAIEAAISGVQESLRASQLIIGYRSNGRPVLKQNFLGRLHHSPR